MKINQFILKRKNYIFGLINSSKLGKPTKFKQFFIQGVAQSVFFQFIIPIFLCFPFSNIQRLRENSTKILIPHFAQFRNFGFSTV